MSVPTWCYDKEGEATLHYLAPGEGPPDGLSLKPPPGTHPHERERAKATVPKAMFKYEAAPDHTAVELPPEVNHVPNPPRPDRQRSR